MKSIIKKWLVLSMVMSLMISPLTAVATNDSTSSLTGDSSEMDEVVILPEAGEDGEETGVGIEDNESLDADTGADIYPEIDETVEGKVEAENSAEEAQFSGRSLKSKNSDTTVTVTDIQFGADGTDGNDDRVAIQKALDVAQNSDTFTTVVVPEGIYHINTMLKIYSNTHLQLDDNAIFVRMDDSYPMLWSATTSEQPEGGYDQVENVTISGGVWDGNVTNLNEKGYGLYERNLIYLWHGKNITIKNTTLKSCVGTHHIELAGVMNALIDNVICEDFVRFADTDYSVIDDIDNMDNEVEVANTTSTVSEAIQLDFAGEANSSNAAPFDMTPCKNIIIQNCTFRNLLGGVGTHHDEVGVKGVKILNNEFINVEGNCINLPNMTDVTISGNTADKVQGFVEARAGSEATLSENTITYDSSRKYGKRNAIYFGDSNVVMKNNEIKGSGTNGICISNSKAVIQGNTVRMPGRAGIRILNSKANMITIENNTVELPKTTGISVDASNVSIRENIVTSAEISGIQVRNGSVGTIKQNTVSSSENNGIDIEKSDMFISDNLINNPIITGIYVSDSKAEIQGNIVKSSGNAGVRVLNSKASTINIANNTIESPKMTGINVDASNIAVSENKVTDAGTNAVQIRNGSGGEIKQNTISDSKNNGIDIEKSGMTISDNLISGTTNAAIYLNNISDKAIVKNNTVKVTGSNGIYASNVVAAIDDNVLENLGAAGIRIMNSKMNSVSIVKNVLKNPKTAGVSVDASNITASGNTVTNAGTNGIQLTGDSLGNISKNVVEKAGNQGISVVNSKNVSINDNKIKDAVANGVYVDTGESVDIKDNEILNSTANAVYITKSKLGITVTGNKIQKSVDCSVGNNGIRILNDSNVTITNNQITDMKSNGINVSLSTINATENTISKSGDNGIYVKGGKVTITQNTIVNNTSKDVLVEDDTSNSFVSTGSVTYNGISEAAIKAVNTVTVKNNGYSLSLCEISKIPVQAHTGGELKPKIEIYFRKIKLVEDSDFSVVYRNNTVVGTATAVVTAKGQYYGTVDVNFAIAGTVTPTPLAVTYTVAYNSNGGKGSMGSQSVVYGKSTQLRANTFTREGYKFTGWSVYRQSDKKWNTTSGWKTEAQMAAGNFVLYIYKDKTSVSTTSGTNGDTVVMYAQWEQER